MRKVRLLKPHTHEGKNYEPGTVLEVEADRADWLMGLGVAELIDKPTARNKEIKEV